jgi:hypothetical protein
LIRIVLALLIFAGCTPSTARKEAEALRSDGAKRIATANAALKELNDAYSINLNPLSETQPASERAVAYDWSKLKAEQRREVKAKLLAHNSNVSRILEITRDKDVLLVGDETGLKRSGEAAWQYYLSLEKFEKHLVLSKRRTHSRH